MKNKLSLFNCFFLIAIQAYSASFSVESKGKLLYYNIIGNTHNVEVTRSDISSIRCNTRFLELEVKKTYNGDIVNNKKYRGRIVIPAKVEYMGEIYNVTGIGAAAFQNCKNLSSISIPNSITTIGIAAFDGCERLTSISIPSGITTIGSFTFNNCNSLRSIDLPNNITKIGYSAFQNCSDLRSILLPNGITSIDSCVFYGCFSLTSIIIPSGVAGIEQNAFSNCLNLHDITIPSSIARIENGAFDICRNLKEITLQSANPIPLQENFFKNTMSSGIKLKVPKGCGAIYQEALGWKDVALMEEY